MYKKNSFSLMARIFFYFFTAYLGAIAPAHAENTAKYGIYSSTLASYEKEWGSLAYKQIEGMELYDVWGTSFIQLIDLNDDGILELLLTRLNKKQSNEQEPITSQKAKILHIFTLDQGKYLKHMGAFPLIQVHLSPSVKWTIVDGKKYIITGNRSDAVEWQTFFWEMTPTGFVQAKSFTSSYGGKGPHGEQRAIDNKQVDEATFAPLYEKWTQAMQSHVVSNCTLEKVEQLKKNNAIEKQKLAPYPALDGVGHSAIFTKGRFLIFEDIPKTAQEKVMAQYFQAYTNANFAKLAQLTVPDVDDLWGINIKALQKRFAEQQYVPGHIIEKMSTIPAGESGYQTVQLTEISMPILKRLSLQEYYFVHAKVNEVKDFSHTDHGPQVGYGTYNYWGLVGKSTAQSPWKLYSIFSDHILYPHMHANPFAVKFLAYTNNWQGMPDLAPYFTDKELATISHKDFGGNEMYIVKNNFAGTTQAYEAVLSDDGVLQSGRLLHTYKPGEIMFFTCNVSDIRPNIILRYTAPYGAVYDFSPSISLVDGAIHYDPYGEELLPK